MTAKARVKPERVRIWHDEYKAEAYPFRVDLDKWIEKGWKVQPAAKKESEQ